MNIGSDNFQVKFILYLLTVTFEEVVFASSEIRNFIVKLNCQCLLLYLFVFMGYLQVILTLSRKSNKFALVQKLIVNFIYAVIDKVHFFSFLYLLKTNSNVINFLIILSKGRFISCGNGVLNPIWPEVYRHRNKNNYRSIIIMGNQNDQQCSKALEEFEKTAINSGEKVLKSPEEAYAIKCPKSILKMFPLLMKKVEFVKNKQNFPGVINVIQFCPVYYLKNLDCYYQGQWLDCLPHGCGIAVYRNESYYEGDFQKGEIQTVQGLYFFNNANDKLFQKPSLKHESQIDHDLSIKNNKSSYYVGQFSKSKFHGKGRIYHKGIIYDGDWVEGKRQGEGKQYTLQFDYSFQGKYSNGLKNEQGVYTRKVDNKVYIYEGSFKNGKFNGQGKVQIDNYLYYNGSFVNGKAEGKGQLILEEGVFRGMFKNNRIKGKGQFQYIKSQKGTMQGQFEQSLDEAGTKRTLFCNKSFITTDNYYEFPILIAQN